MPVETADRPLEQVREEVIDQLVMNYGHGKISLEAFERRLDKAMASQDPVSLKQLTEDLDLMVDQNYVDIKKREMSMKTGYASQGEFDTRKEEEQMIHIFGGGDRTGMWNVPKVLNILNVFGGGDIDFTEARFAYPTVKIKIHSIFGGCNIYVPEDVNVQVNVFSIFGGVSNSAPSSVSADVPTIIIEGMCLFSGVDVKVRRTFKERVTRFADSIKNMLS
ncbi:DUF1707 domain-containing protein [Aliikangiella marina]|uniref:DUF1707 domain-containing protein n=1 Tax=Aliikangiella marina TaxID=1712262 RepID=A0A545THK6_9GAMM|nr:LiaF domain-containing protein [Aliikangiella marina]TQV76714.1 DUF1707 domain-containing protein [Aliikangiella marina]